jgi:putative ABC transport system substrate-binding protein
MNRRNNITLLSAAAVAWPLAARSQSNPKGPKLGFVYPGPKEGAGPRADAVVSGLRASGYPASQLELVVRSTEGDPSRIAPLVAEVIEKHVTAIITVGPAVLRYARAATREIAIVATDLESDPVASGIVASLARAGGNVTGVFLDFPDFAAKWIELLVESIPGLARIAVMWDPATGALQLDSVRKTAGSLKLQTEILEVRVRDDFDAAFSLASQHAAGAVILLSSPLIGGNTKILADLAFRHRLPAITLFPDFARTGGLFAYGPSLLGMFRQAGVLAAKVLRGRDPADLPIERPTKFEFIFNTRTAESFGMSVPPSILLRADEMIE